MEKLVDALERLYRAPAPPGAARSAPEEGTSPRREDAYAAAVHFFGRREASLQAEQRVSTRIIEQLREASPPVPQQVLAIRGAPGEVAGGRFRLRNLTQQAARFAFQPRFELVPRFAPSRLTLDPGASAAVDVRLDLPAAMPLEARTLLVDVLADGRPAMKLWLDLQVDHPLDGRSE